MTFQIVPGYDRQEDILALFTEYTAMLVASDKKFAYYLDIQHYDDELRDLRAKYGEPAGRLYVALAEDGAPAGCIALHRLDDERCELKRLYVRPAYRGQGLGSRLVARILDDARQIGYRAMLLDTLPVLDSAVRMYRGLGFYEIPCYNDSPIDETYFFRLDL
ncbi:MAG: GNAT family N-acetyltransferase [Oscillospiraceae bacterium]|nr:GNAT family N-acetyltransferase [Oscillospiraceae bacterium]